MKKWKIFNRLWHWINAFVIFYLMISSLLIESDISLIAIKNHVLCGYLLILLFIVRVVYILSGFDIVNTIKGKLLVEKSIYILRSKKFKDFTKEERYVLKKAGAKISYLLLVFILFGIIITGILLEYKSELYLVDYYANIKYIHEILFYFILIFTTMHILGVVFAECTNEPNIISDMINGGKENDDAKE